VLERAAEGYLAWMEAASAPSVGTPRDRILALFDALAEQVRPEHCRGCPFLMALAEYPDEDSAPLSAITLLGSWPFRCDPAVGAERRCARPCFRVPA
jgi:AcrR family transcriptional regulator